MLVLGLEKLQIPPPPYIPTLLLRVFSIAIDLRSISPTAFRSILKSNLIAPPLGLCLGNFLHEKISPFSLLLIHVLLTSVAIRT